MNSHTALIPVEFDGDTLVLADHDGQPFVPMKPVVENMGLAWQSQHIKLTEKFGSTITIIVTVAEDGKPREMVCLPLRKFPAWVYSVNPGKVAPELREKILRYQEECDDVLWKYWTEGHVERPGARRAVDFPARAHALLMKLPDCLERERHPAKRELLKAQITQACQTLGITPPDLDQIGRAGIAQESPPELDVFWDVVDMIGRETLDHAISPQLMALNLAQVQQVAKVNRLPLPSTARLRHALPLSTAPRFIEANRVVHSALLKRAVRCWVFEPESASI
jgi:hypothetical protein